MVENKKTRLAKIGKLGDKIIVSAFVPKGKEFTLEDLKRAIGEDFDKDYTKQEEAQKDGI